MYFLQNATKKKKQTSRTSLISDTNDAKKTGALHKRLTNEWQLQGPDTKRILLDKHKTRSLKRKEAFVSANQPVNNGNATALRKGANKLRTMSHHEQMHKLQSALQDRIMIHKSNDEMSVVSKGQVQSIQHLMEYLNKEMEIPTGPSICMKTRDDTAPKKPIKSFVEMEPSMLVSVADRFYKDKIYSRTVDDKVFSNKLGAQSTSSNTRLRQKTRQNVMVDKMFKEGTNVISEDFPNILRENETDIYFMLGMPSCPSVKQLLSTFRDVHRSSLKSEQELYHLFRLSILSNRLNERAYSSKYLL